MSSPAIQLTFALRTSANVQSVHLVGSWDGYKSQLPLSTVKDAGAKPGSWKGVFRFQGTHALKLGSRYWYYYICDGYHVSHDPAKEFMTEKTTGRKLNILDVPTGKTSSTKTASTATKTSRHNREVPQGRPVSPSRIACPKPSKPYASRQLREADYEANPVDAMDEMAEKFTMAVRMGERPAMNYNSSDISDASSASGRSFSSLSGSSSTTSSSSSADECTCQRYGVTRDGRRVKLDCGGAKCGYTNDSDCSESESESESEDERPVRQSRHTAPAPKKVAPAQVSRHAAPVASRRRH